MYHQPQLVDEVVVKQGLDEGGAPIDEDITTIGFLRDPRDSIELWTRRILVRNGDLLGMQGLHHVDSGSTSRREG
jgi:hypothetical protein